jgi:AmmeMemoRadiSam system protein B/AmmeMemoRadiSam system protein A
MFRNKSEEFLGITARFLSKTKRVSSMRHRIRVRFFIALGMMSLVLLASNRPILGDRPKVRQPAVAGAFYPADPKELSKMVDEFLAKAVVPEIKDPILAVVAPHAGYIYSGPVAGHTYALLRGKKYARVVVISPSHFEAFSFSSIYDGDAYATPLGTVAVDKAFTAKLAKMDSSLRLSERGHTPRREQAEHSLEVQLPFLQRVLGEFQLVPIVMGDQSYESSRALGVSLAKLLDEGRERTSRKGRTQRPPSELDTLIVASSDLSHYHPYTEAVKLDHKTLNAVAEWDTLSLARNFERRVWEACGGAPIVAAMIASERLGANQARVIKYANSGDTTGDRGRVVGYGSVVFVASQSVASQKDPEFSLSQRDKDELMRVAKMSVEIAVKQQKLYELPPGEPESLVQERGAFVTLKEKGQLRGCIGYVAPIKSLVETVRDVAAFAALKDTRFPPVTAAELGQLEYEISVLSPLRRVNDVKQIKVGRHGLMVKKGEDEGLLLPQVPTEQGWDRNTFLEQTCLKAGLPQQAWRDEDTDIFSFTALVFGDHERPDPPKVNEPAQQKWKALPGLPAQGSARP